MRRVVLVSVLAGSLTASLVLTTASAGADTSRALAAAAAPTTAGLALSYRFDNDTGVRATDSSVNATHGTYVNTTAAAARATGAPGESHAIALTGSKHQYVAVPERNTLDVDRFTLAAWVRYTGVQNDKTFDRWEVLEKPAAYWMNVRTTGRVRVGGYFGGCTWASWKWLDSTVTIPKNTWTHVAGTYNGSTLTIWVNGIRAGAKAVTGRTCSNNYPLAVGAKNYPPQGVLEAFWDGRLDDIRVYGRALSATEIRGLLP